MQKTISKSNKKRLQGPKYQPKGDVIHKSGFADHWIEVVEITPIGKNKKGKTIHKSQTKHIRA